MTNKEDLEELPLKYTKGGFTWGPGFRKKGRISVGTKLSPGVVEAWKALAQMRGEPLNKVLSDLILAEFNRLAKAAA